MIDNQSEENLLAKRMVDDASPMQREVLLEWTNELTEIRNSSDSNFSKARRAVQATIKRDVLVPILKTSFVGIKKQTWDERNWAERMLIAGVTIGTLGLSGQAAGIAAFGRAIAVPMVLVLGASGAFLGTLIDLLKEKKPNANRGEDTTILAQQEDTDV